MKHLALVLSIALLLPSCATLSDRPLAAKIVVQQATLRFIGSDAERAQRVVETAERLQALVNSEPVSVEDLQRQAMQAIEAAGLSTEDNHLATSLVLLVGEELRARVGDQTIPPPGLVEAQEVLGWVSEAAGLVGP